MSGAAVSRRDFLLAGAATVVAAGSGAALAVDRGWLPGRIPLRRALERCEVDAPPPTAAPGPVRVKRFRSTFRRTDVVWVLALPPAVAAGGTGQGSPVALVLHGRGEDARTPFDVLGLHRFLAAHVTAGGRPFALASVDGGQAYWHPRARGDDPLGMIAFELLPRLRAAGLRTDRLGALGWSMGGYGALLLARRSPDERLARIPVRAVAVSSPALFPSFGEVTQGAFDGPEDFATWGDLLADPGIAPGTALFVACGDTDPFASATRRYRSTVRPVPAGSVGRGCHEAPYWRTQAASQIAFLGAALHA
jgi:hypothetical protein